MLPTRDSRRTVEAGGLENVFAGQHMSFSILGISEHIRAHLERSESDMSEWKQEGGEGTEERIGLGELLSQRRSRLLSTTFLPQL